MANNSGVQVEVIPTSRRGSDSEAITAWRAGVQARAIIALCAGIVCAMPYGGPGTAIFVATAVGVGRVTYLSLDTYFVHFADESPGVNHAMPASVCTPVGGGNALDALVDLLRTNPTPTTDLDADYPDEDGAGPEVVA